MRIRRIAIVSTTACTLLSLANLAGAQTPLDTSFKFQGELRQNNIVVNTNHDFIFDVFGFAAGGGSLGTNAVNNVPVSRGVFTVELDFGAGIFTGDKRWVQIRVRPTGGGAFTTLNPRVELNATPNALFAEAVADNSVSSVKIADLSVTSADLAAGAVGSSKIATNAVSSTKIVDGSVGAVDIGPDVVSSVDGVSNDGGNINLVAGSNMSIVPNDGANTITFTASSNSSTLDGLDSTQFLRSDVPDTFTGGTLAMSSGTTISTGGGSPNALTFGGANLSLNLGDSAADETNVRGLLNVVDDAIVGDDMTVGGSIVTVGSINTGSATSTPATIFSNFGGAIPGSGLISNDGDVMVQFDLETGADLSVRGGDLFLGGSESDSEVHFFEDGSANGEELEWDDSTDRFEFSDELQVQGEELFLGTTATTTIRFFEGNTGSFDHRIAWEDGPVDATGLTTCAVTGAIDSAFIFDTGDIFSSGWAFTNGTDPEVTFDELGIIAADSTINASGGCDLAESFLGPDDLEPGTLLRADPKQTEGVLPTERAYDPTMVGIVTSMPAFRMNGGTQDVYPVIEELMEVREQLRAAPGNAELERRFMDLELAVDSWQRGNVDVALVGRVPLKVVGAVNVGDALTSSDVTGHAMAMDRPGPSIGIALERTNGGRGTVLTLIQPGWRQPLVDGEEREGAGGVADASRQGRASFESRLSQIEAQLGGRATGRDLRDDQAGRDGVAGRDGESGRDARDGDDGRAPVAEEDDTSRVVRLRRETWGDFDADGLDDVLVLNAGAGLSLYKNLGDGSFEDVTRAAGLEETVGTRIALWQDYDADRRLDLLVVDADGVAGLLRGAGTGAFGDVTDSLGLDFGQPIVDAEWLDYDDDSLPDLRVELDDGTLMLHHNLGQGAFETVELRSAAADGGPSRVAELETENAEMRDRLEALEALVQQLAAKQGAN